MEKRNANKEKKQFWSGSCIFKLGGQGPHWENDISAKTWRKWGSESWGDLREGASQVAGTASAKALRWASADLSREQEEASVATKEEEDTPLGR